MTLPLIIALALYALAVATLAKIRLHPPSAVAAHALAALLSIVALTAASGASAPTENTAHARR